MSRSGRPRLDYLAVASLAFPFMVNSAVQAVLNATDTWFIGRVSPAATSAIGAVYWPVLVFGLLFGGVGLAVQTLVAQAYGGRRYARASQATWTALWASLFTVPAFVLLALTGANFRALRHSAGNLRLALAYWFPRMLGGPLGVALWAVLGFFNGIGRPTVTLRIAAGVAVINALFNQLFMFNLDMGVAGSAWATNCAQLIGVCTALAWFLAPATRSRFRSHLTTRLHVRSLWRQLQLGFPMGLLIAADILGFALFQLMQVRLGTVDGASTQIVMMLTSFCYMPAVGIAMAGTTLVGQAIGAHRKDWALKVGNGIILIAVLYMGVIGVLLAALGPWVLPFFTNAADPQAALVVRKSRDLAVDCGRLSIVRRIEYQQQRDVARRGRCAASGAHGACAVVAGLRAACAQPVVRAGPRVGRLVAAVRLGRGRRLVCGIGLHFLPGNHAVSALALARLAAYRAAPQLMKPLTLLLKRMLLACAGGVFSAAAAAAGSGGAVPAAIAQVMAAQRLPSSALSFVIVDADTGRVVMSHNEDTPRSPASTMKALTTFAALDMLGPAFVWHTRAWLRDGDLYLQGGGDPYMTLERWWSFVQGLRALGLKSIPGDIVIDNSAFSLPREDPGAFDGRPNRAYNVVPDALMVNFQSVDFNLAANADTHRVDIVASPAPVNLEVDNRIRYLPGRCGGAAARVDFQVASPKVEPRGVFRGLVRALRAAFLRANFAAAGDLCLRHLRRVVARVGGRVRR